MLSTEINKVCKKEKPKVNVYLGTVRPTLNYIKWKPRARYSRDWSEAEDRLNTRKQN